MGAIGVMISAPRTMSQAHASVPIHLGISASLLAIRHKSITSRPRGQAAVPPRSFEKTKYRHRPACPGDPWQSCEIEKTSLGGPDGLGAGQIGEVEEARAN